MRISGKTSSRPPFSTTNDLYDLSLTGGIAGAEDARGAWTRQGGSRAGTNMETHVELSPANRPAVGLTILMIK